MCALDTIITPLTKLINLSIESCCFPDALKKATVVRIHKKESLDDMNNYRPIAIQPTLSKIFEKILYEQILDFFEKYDLFTRSQFGFMRGLSTAHAVEDFFDHIVDGFENNKNAEGIFLDLTKAFDCVSHDILIRKLYMYNFHPAIVRLIQSYLANRYQRVSYNQTTSSYSQVQNGIPQGVVVGPLLFLLYLNDLPYHLDPTFTTLFADDTTFCVIGENEQMVHKAANMLT